MEPNEAFSEAQSAFNELMKQLADMHRRCAQLAIERDRLAHQVRDLCEKMHAGMPVNGAPRPGEPPE